MYGHMEIIAEAEQAGLKKAGIEADIFQYTLLPLFQTRPS